LQAEKGPNGTSKGEQSDQKEEEKNIVAGDLDKCIPTDARAVDRHANLGAAACIMTEAALVRLSPAALVTVSKKEKPDSSP